MSAGRRLTVLLKVLAVFLLIGPPVGALTLFVGIGVYGASQTGDVASIWWLSLFGLIYAVPLSYLVGYAPAAAAGLILGATAALHHVPGLLFAAATGLVVGLWLVHAGGMSVMPPGAETGADYVPVVLLVSMCVVATVLCWAVARCIIGNPPPLLDASRPPL